MQTTRKESPALIEFEHDVVLDAEHGAPPAGDPLWRMVAMTPEERAACSIIGYQLGDGVLKPATIEHDQPEENLHAFEATSGAHKSSGAYAAFVLLDGDGTELFRHHIDPPVPVKAGQRLRVAFLFRVGMPSGGTGAALGATAKVEVKDVETE